MSIILREGDAHILMDSLFRELSIKIVSHIHGYLDKNLAPGDKKEIEQAVRDYVDDAKAKVLSLPFEVTPHDSEVTS